MSELAPNPPTLTRLDPPASGQGPARLSPPSRPGQRHSMPAGPIRRLPPSLTTPRPLAPRVLASRTVSQVTALTSTVTYRHADASDLATGRGFTYEWELFVADILDRLGSLESGGGGGSGGASFVHTQATAAANWTLVHNLGTKPDVVIVEPGGDLLYAEVSYPDDSTVVITFGQPYAGTAYLRG